MDLYQKFKEQGYNFFCGIPCSKLKEFIQEIIDDPEMIYIPCTREDEAVGIAVGAYFTGKKPLVYMQNSGLGNVVDIVASLLRPYNIPIHLLISSRSKPEHHAFMHKITKKLLELLEYKNYTIIEQK